MALKHAKFCRFPTAIMTVVGLAYAAHAIDADNPPTQDGADVCPVPVAPSRSERCRRGRAHHRIRRRRPGTGAWSKPKRTDSAAAPPNKLTASDPGCRGGNIGPHAVEDRERQISPSLGTLQALAQALNVKPPALRNLRGATRYLQCACWARRHNRAPRHQGRPPIQLLGDRLGGPVVAEPYLITLHQDAVPYTGFRHAGVEFIYMLDRRSLLPSRRTNLSSPSRAWALFL